MTSRMAQAPGSTLSGTSSSTRLRNGDATPQPEIAGQWHLTKLGDIDAIWRDYTGKGVHVGVYDSGIQRAHYDLDDNYDASRHLVIDGVTYDGDYRPASGGHGTSVAGVIAAERNGIGTTGVSYGASVTGVNIFDPYSGDGVDPSIAINGGRGQFVKALELSAGFDVVNHSWGLASKLFEADIDRSLEGTFNYRMAQAFAFAAETGRGGLGTISVRSAGNDAIDIQADPSKTDRHVIAVGAYRQVDGYAASYSQRGGALLVSAPSDDRPDYGGTGIVTTDLIGRYGSNTHADPGGLQDHTDQFGGTSAAAPIVSGVASLMLEANASLGWRDVGSILALSAKLPVAFDAAPASIVSTAGATVKLNESRFAVVGGDAHWNGGGMHYSTDYGFGAVDAFAAVRMAEVWSLFGPARTSRNEASVSSGTIALELAVAQPKEMLAEDAIAAAAHAGFVGTPTTATFRIDAGIDIEAVDLHLSLDVTTFNEEEGTNRLLPAYLKLKLISPDGVEMFVDAAGTLGDTSFASPATYTFGFQGFRGAASAGEWTVQFEYPRVGEQLTIHSVKLDLFGAAPSADDVHHVTDEFFAMAATAGGAARLAMADRNGGTDWINAAAVTGDVVLSLRGGSTATIDGRDAFTIDPAGGIENVVTGDGDDRLEGDGGANRIVAMRGDDRLSGGDGADTLDGGAGDDWIDGGSGDDTLTGGAGADRFVFDNARRSGADRLVDLDDTDTILLTARLADRDGDGRIELADGMLALDGPWAGDRLSLGAVSAVEYDGVVRVGGVTYYAYSTPGDAPASPKLPATVATMPAPAPAPAPAAEAGAPPATGTRQTFGVWTPSDAQDDARGPGVVTRDAVTVQIAAAPATPAPEGSTQWHLGKLGKLATVWSDYSGKGVHVGVYDSGVEYDHADLDGNYDASRHLVLGGKTFDGDVRPDSGPHGTSVAGIIAAERNGEGAVGVAFGSAITGVNIFDQWSGGGRDPGIFINGGDRKLFVDALTAQSAFDIANHSWGPTDSSYATGTDRGRDDTFAAAVTKARASASAIGRDGLGTISVVSAGNSGLDVQGNSLGTDRHLVTVAAYREVDGNASSYSQRGAALLISAPSDDNIPLGGTGVVTTDLVGRYGYNLTANQGADSDITDRFGGTSAAAPMVSGVVALMLEANAGLGWRDVSNILAHSARLPVAFDTGPTRVESAAAGSTRLNESRFAIGGAAAHSNGGGLHYSTDYGYGAVDAYAATRMAEAWHLFGVAKTSANEATGGSGRVAIGKTVDGSPDPDFLYEASKHTDFFGTPTSFTFDVTDRMDIEAVDLRLEFDLGVRYYDATLGESVWGYQTLTAVRFKLISPDGTAMFVDTTGGAGASVTPGEDGRSSFTFGFQGFRGATSAGTWTLQVEVPNTDLRLELHALKLDLFGATSVADDVFHYTDEFLTMAAVPGEDGRRTLIDADGGVDWIDAAAVSSDVSLSLVAGAATTFGGTLAFTLDRRAAIENAVTGDGDDRLTGDRGDNTLYGMRGDDVLNGGEGRDRLAGGTGSDTFTFDARSGQDTILDWSAGDAIATTRRIAGARDGIVAFGADEPLRFVNGGADTITFDGADGALREMGRANGYYFYGDADVRPLAPAGMTVVEGTVGNETLRSSAGAELYFFDTAHAPTGRDGIQRFGANDLIVTTSAIDDPDGDGRIAPGSNRLLDLPGRGGELMMPTRTMLEFDGSVVHDNVTYYVYSLIGSPAGLPDIVFG